MEFKRINVGSRLLWWRSDASHWSQGRRSYVVMGKDGRKTAKDAVDMGVTAKESVVGVDLDDLHESMKQLVKTSVLLLVGKDTRQRALKRKTEK